MPAPRIRSSRPALRPAGRPARRAVPAALASAALAVAAVVAPVAPANAATIGPTFPVGNGPIDVAFTSDGSLGFVSDYEGATVTVIDAATRTTVASIPVGAYPVRIEARPDGEEIWVASQGNDTVSVIDVSTLSVVASIPVSGDPGEIAFAPDSSRAYVAGVGVNALLEVDTATRAIDAAVALAGYPLSVVTSPSGGSVYVSENSGNSIAEVDTTTGTVARRLSLPGAHSLALTPDGSTLYASTATQQAVAKIDVASWTITESVTVNGTPFMIDLAGNALLVPRIYTDLSILNTSDLSTRQTLAVGQGVRAVKVRPGANEAWALRLDDDEVRVIALDAPPVISTTSVPDAELGEPYSASVAASGEPAATFAVTTGALPAGLLLDGATGEISGTPTATGSFTFTVTATNVGGSDARPFTIVVGEAPVITTTTLADAVEGSAYSTTVAASGSPAPTFAVTAGALPAGLTLDGATGEISGTPTADGSVTFTVTASNTVAGASATDSRAFTLLVTSPPVFTSTTLAAAREGEAYASTFAASGNPAPTFAVTAGTLPPGLTLDAAAGELSGTPTASGTFAFTVTASNTAGTADASLTLTVAAAPTPPPAIASTGAASGAVAPFAAAATLLGAALLLLRRRRGTHSVS